MEKRIKLSFCVDCGSRLIDFSLSAKLCPKCLLVHENTSLTPYSVDSIELFHISKEEFLEWLKETNPSRREHSV